MAPINTTPAPFTIQLPALPPQALPPAGAVLIYFDQVSGKLKAIDSTGTSVLVGVVNGAAGADTDVQFNDGGGLGGSVGLTYDKTTKSFTANGGTDAASFIAAGTTQNNFIEVVGQATGPDHGVFIGAEETGGVIDVSADADVTFNAGGDLNMIAGTNSLNSLEVSGNAGDNGIFANAKESGAVLNLEADQDVSITSDHAHVDITSGTGISITPGTLLSFFGAAGSAKPTVTGAKGGNAALTSLLTALANLGLITNSTT